MDKEKRKILNTMLKFFEEKGYKKEEIEEIEGFRRCGSYTGKKNGGLEFQSAVLYSWVSLLLFGGSCLFFHELFLAENRVSVNLEEDVTQVRPVERFLHLIQLLLDVVRELLHVLRSI